MKNKNFSLYLRKRDCIDVGRERFLKRPTELIKF